MIVLIVFNFFNSMIYHQSRYIKNDTKRRRSISLDFLNVHVSNKMNNDNKAMQKSCAYIKYMYIFILWLYWTFLISVLYY